MSATLTPVFTEIPRSDWRPGDPFLFRRVRTWWVLVALCLLAQQNANIFLPATAAGEKLKQVHQLYAPSTTLFLLTLLTWTIYIVLILTRLTPTLRTLANQTPVLLYVALAFLSTLWSQDPRLTMRRAAALLLFCGFAWLFASSYSPRDQMRLLLTTGIILASASIAMAVLLPQYGLDTDGEWRGVFGQKNALGHAVLFLFSCLAFMPKASRRLFSAENLLATGAIGLIILSRSKGALLLALLIIAIRVYGPFFRRVGRSQRPFVLFVTGLVIFVIAFGREILLSLVGRDSTLTGRTLEWSILFPFALRHALLGYGYQAFWTGEGDSLSAMKTLGGGIHGADSGYLDNMLQLGLLGDGLFVFIALVALRDFLRLYRRPAVPLAAYWYFGIVIAIMVGSIVEGLFSVPSGINSFVFLIACAGLRALRSGDRDGTAPATQWSQP